MEDLMDDLESQGAMFDMGEIYRRLFGGRASCSQGCCHSMASTWILGSSFSVPVEDSVLNSMKLFNPSKEQVRAGGATDKIVCEATDSVLDQSLIEPFTTFPVQIESKDSLLDDDNNNQPTGVGAGLYNSGNTCYIASVLQCFTHTIPLIESLRSYNRQIPCNCGNDSFCVMQALCDHIQLASGHKLGIDRFRENIEHFSPDFQIDNQEDAYEFLQSFLDKLEQCCKDESISSQDNNIVDHVFGGLLLCRLRCCSCYSSSDTYEPSLRWSLEIEDRESLRNALESFTNVEKLEELTCDDCCDNRDEKVSKVKQLKLHKLPLVAIIHLKTFKNNMEKILKHIEFSLELDLLPYMSYNQNSEVSTKYELYAMVEHLGRYISSGHYISYVKSRETWYQFDDDQVTKVTEEYVLTRNAYILFYAREGTATNWLVAEKEKEDEEAKQFLVDTIVHESIVNSNFMEDLRLNKVEALKHQWDEKRKLEKEELKKKREVLKKKREKQNKVGKKK